MEELMAAKLKASSRRAPFRDAFCAQQVDNAGALPISAAPAL